MKNKITGILFTLLVIQGLALGIYVCILTIGSPITKDFFELHIYLLNPIPDVGYKTEIEAMKPIIIDQDFTKVI